MGEVPLPEKIREIHRVLTEAGLPHAFGGALALAYYGEPRTTVDIDVNVFVEPGRFGEVVGALEPFGVERVPDGQGVSRDGQGRIWWGRTPVDLFLAYHPIHEAMRAALRAVPFGESTIPILAPEHLLVAKAVSDRPKDWLDIEQVLVACPDLDLAEVHRWLDHLLGSGDRRLERFAGLESRVLGPQRER